ncbi:CcmD family protein [bacterium]|nr:CcmD family protein [bacterium]
MRLNHFVRRLSLLSMLVALSVSTSEVHGQVARLVHYQGELKNADGSLVNGTVDLHFAIYKSPLSEQPLWSEVHKNVAISEGKYDVMLGSQNPLDLSYYEYFLQVRPNGQPTDQPRIRIVGSGYNFRLWFLFAAYTIVWIALFAYLLSISNRQKKIITEMQSLAKVT